MLIFKQVIHLDYSKINAPDEGHRTELTVYIPNDRPEVSHYTQKRPTVIILPGGAYSSTSEREADPVAVKYLAHGFNACILRYSCAPSVYPVAMLEALSGVKYIRENAEKFYADPEQIYICGFSAGGHLAASCGTHWHREESRKYFSDVNAVKPNGLILCYPVITSGEYVHRGSFNNLLGEKKDDAEMLEYLSLEKQVDENTPTSFIWATNGDTGVHCENSLLFALALRRAKVPMELHIFENGPHGISTADTISTCMDYPVRTRSWVDMTCDWIVEKTKETDYIINKN